jgi:hypothetical protein
VIIAAVAAVLAGLVAGGAVWQVKRSEAKAAEAAAAEARNFGPRGYGKLKLGMAKPAALATGDLGPEPVAVTSTCQDHSFKGGPAPDPAQMAADAKLDKDLADAQKKADALKVAADARPGPNAGAKQLAESAQRSADYIHAVTRSLDLSLKVVERIGARMKARDQHGGVTFTDGKLRLIAAPPGARTAEGVGTGSPEADLKKAYAAKGLKQDKTQYEMAVPGSPGWQYLFGVENGKVTSMVMANQDIACK